MLLQKYQCIILGLIFPLKVEINKEQTQNYFFSYNGIPLYYNITQIIIIISIKT